jgi:hypothetical protein
MIGLDTGVKYENPLFGQLLYRHLSKPLVVGMQLTTLCYESYNYNESNGGVRLAGQQRVLLLNTFVDNKIH